jgi:hypothetical protein
VEVRVDDGPWRPAAIDGATRSRYGWTLFVYRWTGASPGPHSVVSRAIDVNGIAQPGPEARRQPDGGAADNSQRRRTVTIS